VFFLDQLFVPLVERSVAGSCVVALNLVLLKGGSLDLTFWVVTPPRQECRQAYRDTSLIRTLPTPRTSIGH
jgi:hypothetical protein